MADTLTDRLHDEIDAIEVLESEVDDLVDQTLRRPLRQAIQIALTEDQPLPAVLETLIEGYAAKMGGLTTKALKLGMTFGERRSGGG